MRAVILLTVCAVAGWAGSALADPLYDLPTVGNSVVVRVTCPNAADGQIEIKMCSNSDGSSAIGRIQLHNGEMESMVFDTFEFDGKPDRHIVGRASGMDADSEKVRRVWITLAPIKRTACDASPEQQAHIRKQLEKNKANTKCTKN